MSRDRPYRSGPDHMPSQSLHAHISVLHSILAFLVAVTYICFYNTDVVTRVINGVLLVIVAIPTMYLSVAEWGVSEIDWINLPKQGYEYFQALTGSYIAFLFSRYKSPSQSSPA